MSNGKTFVARPDHHVPRVDSKPAEPKEIVQTLDNVCKFYINTGQCTAGSACKLWYASLSVISVRTHAQRAGRHPTENVVAIREEWIKRREDNRKLKWAQHGDTQVRPL